MAYIYRHIRLDKNEPFYIGIGSDDNGKFTRAKRKTYRSKFWTNIINKTEYEIEIIENNLTWEEAKEKEKWWILFYGRLDIKTGILANLTDGGDGMIGWNATDETRKHLSEIRKGKCFRKPGWKMTEEQKKNLREKRMGKPPSNKGIPLTKEQKEKVSEAKRGNPSHRRKSILCIETGEVFPSIEHAEKDPRFYRGGVAKVLKGWRKSIRGFTFKYTE
jgi:hypothetical protein